MEPNPVLKTQTDHVTIRSFTDEPVPEETLAAILEAGRRAPTSSNMQAYSVLVVKNQQVKLKLAELAGGQKHIETCPVFLAFCADIHRLEKVCELHDIEMNNNLESLLISTIDASLVGMSVQTAVESCGMGAVMIGAMRNHPVEAARLLDLPRGVYVVFGMCIGWPVTEAIPPQKPRLPAEMVIHRERYDGGDISAGVEVYNRAIAEHYQSLGKNQHEDAWSGPISRHLSKPLRSGLPKSLRQLGFKLGG